MLTVIFSSKCANSNTCQIVVCVWGLLCPNLFASRHRRWLTLACAMPFGRFWCSFCNHKQFFWNYNALFCHESLGQKLNLSSIILKPRGWRGTCGNCVLTLPLLFFFCVHIPHRFEVEWKHRHQNGGRRLQGLGHQNTPGRRAAPLVHTAKSQWRWGPTVGQHDAQVVQPNTWWVWPITLHSAIHFFSDNQPFYQRRKFLLHGFLFLARSFFWYLMMRSKFFQAKYF